MGFENEKTVMFRPSSSSIRAFVFIVSFTPTTLDIYTHAFAKNKKAVSQIMQNRLEI